MKKKSSEHDSASMFSLSTIVGALMVIVGLFFTYAAVKAIVTTPATVRRIKEAPFITNGVVDPENEGKTVILALDLTDMGDATDDAFGFTFPYPFVSREVERLKCTLAYKKWEWVRETDSEESLGSRSFFGDVSVGNFQVEGDLLRGLGRRKDLFPSDFNEQQLNDFMDRYDSVSLEIWNDRFYITNSNSLYFENYEFDGDEIARSNYEDQEGSIRVRYLAVPREEYSKIAVIGKQQGNWIVEDDRVDSMTVFENVDSSADVAKDHLVSMGIGIAIELAICIPLMLFGINMIRKQY